MSVCVECPYTQSDLIIYRVRTQQKDIIELFNIDYIVRISQQGKLYPFYIIGRGTAVNTNGVLNLMEAHP